MCGQVEGKALKAFSGMSLGDIAEFICHRSGRLWNTLGRENEIA